jgi:hypothetical protein
MDDITTKCIECGKEFTFTPKKKLDIRNYCSKTCTQARYRRGMNVSKARDEYNRTHNETPKVYNYGNVPR